MTVLKAATTRTESSGFSSYAIPDSAASRLAPYVSEGVEITYKNFNLHTLDISLGLDSTITKGAVSFYMYWEETSTSNWDYNVFALYSNTGNTILRLYRNFNSSLFNIYHADADSTESNIAASIPPTGLTRWDIEFKIAGDATGYFKIYQNKVLVYSISGANNGRGASFYNIKWVRTGGGAGARRTMSAMMIADESTLPLDVCQQAPNSDGTLFEWTGSYAQVDGIGYDSGDFVETVLADKTFLVNFPDIPAGLSGGTIDFTQIVAIGNAPNLDLDVIARSGGTNYDEGLIGAAGFAVGAVLKIPQDPDTLAAWTISGLNAAEFGLKSVTS